MTEEEMAEFERKIKEFDDYIASVTGMGLVGKIAPSSVNESHIKNALHDAFLMIDALQVQVVALSSGLHNLAVRSSARSASQVAEAA